MSDQKPFLVLWSQAAVDAAGPNLSPLQAKLLEETTEIMTKAHDCFLHVFGRTEELCYLCTGNEFPDQWKMYVQIGRWAPLPPIRDDHPDPERRGKVFKMPEALKEPDNEVFALFENLA